MIAVHDSNNIRMRFIKGLSRNPPRSTQPGISFLISKTAPFYAYLACSRHCEMEFSSEYPGGLAIRTGTTRAVEWPNFAQFS
jgi:hypothetical protein